MRLIKSLKNHITTRDFTGKLQNKTKIFNESSCVSRVSNSVSTTFSLQLTMNQNTCSVTLMFKNCFKEPYAPKDSASKI